MSGLSVVVVTPTVGSPFLHEAIESVQAQTYARVRHLIVVDGPRFTSAVDAIVDRYAAGDKPIDLIRLPHNTGAGRFRGHRIYAASPFLTDADVLLNLDDDNWFDAEHVEECVANLEGHRCDWTYAFRRIRLADGSIVCDDDSDSIGCWPRYRTLQLGTGCLPASDEAFLSLYRHLVDTNCYAIRRHLYARVASSWVYGHGADSIVADVLIRTAPVASTTRTTVNYRLGSASSVEPSFFLDGNAIMRRLYRSTYPWRYPQAPRLGPIEHTLAGRGDLAPKPGR
jgi:glycosyltransferase involved in cell wall biosynthesis